VRFASYVCSSHSSWLSHIVLEEYMECLCCPFGSWVAYIHTTHAWSRRGSRGVSDIPPKYPRFTKMIFRIYKWRILRRPDADGVRCLHTYIHTTHALSSKGQQSHLRYSSEMPTFYHNYSAMRNTADMAGGKPIAVRLQSISGGHAVNPLVTFYDIHGRKREVLFFCSVPDTTRDWIVCM
jgi:hypothetical protein